MIRLLAVVTFGLAAGLPCVRPEHGYRVLIGAEHLAIVKLEAFTDTFEGRQPVNIAWKCEEAWACSHPLYRTSVERALDIWHQLSTIRRITGEHERGRLGRSERT